MTASIGMWVAPLGYRFLQTDPVGYEDDLNLYAYVRNDPLNGSDPSGSQVAIGIVPPPPITGAQPQEQTGWGPTLGEIGQAAADLAETAGRLVLSNIILSVPGAHTVFSESAEPAPPPDLTDDRGREHILTGDETGGGHRAGTGLPGKSEFPAEWSDERILGEISDVATDPASDRQTQGSRTVSEGERGGVGIRTVDTGTRIVTGHPTNRPRNPK